MLLLCLPSSSISSGCENVCACVCVCDIHIERVRERVRVRAPASARERVVHTVHVLFIPTDHSLPWQEDGVNDVGPMISPDMISRTEILRPDSALIPSNEAEKPR